MRSTKGWAGLSAGVLMMTGLAACGGGGPDPESDPKAALTGALEAFEDYDGIELVVSLDGDREALVAAAEGDLDEPTVDLLLSSSLLLRAAGDDEDDAQAELIADLGGDTAVEVRILPEQRFFLRLDLAAVTTAIDDPETTEALNSAVGMAESFGLEDIAAAVRAGSWVELTGVEQLAEFAGGASDEEPSEAELEDLRHRIVASFQRFVDQDVTLAHVGEETAGERITATTTSAALSGLLEEISAIAGQVSGIDPEMFGAPQERPGGDREIDVDFWIEDGRLNQIGFDLSQLEDGSAPEGTYLLMTVDEFAGSVEAPEDATEVDLFAIMGNLLGGGMGDLGGDLGGGDQGGDDQGGGGDLGEGGQDDALDGMCFTEEQLDEMTAGDEGARAELDEAIELGIIEVC